MASRDDAVFGYRIQATADGWSWVAYNPEGQLEARGNAPSKAVAAALVIRAFARAASPGAALPNAA